MREITIKINDDDYLHFQTVANESGLRKDFTDNCFNQSFNRK